MYAERKGWPLESVEVAVSHDKVYEEDCQNCDDPQSKIDRFQRTISLKGPLSEEQVERLKVIAQRCPVHRTLVSMPKVVDVVELLS